MERRIPILWNEVREHGETESARADNDQNPAASMPSYRFRAAQHHPTAYEKQDRAAEQYYWQEQLRLAKELNVLTKWLNWITGVASGVGVIGLIFIACTLVETGRQVDIAERSLALSERPWVVVDHGMVQSLTFDKMGNLILQVEEKERNVGKSVAVDVFSWATVVPLDPGGGYGTALVRQKETCNALRRPQSNTQGITGIVLFPDQEDSVSLITTVTVPAEEIVKARSLAPRGMEGKVGFAFIGCVSYRASFEPPESERYQTGFLYYVALREGAKINPFITPEGVHENMHLVRMYIGEFAY